MNKKHFNNVHSFIISIVISVPILAINAYMIFLNQKNIPAFIFLIVCESILFAMFIFIMIGLIFYLKCFSIYYYNEQQIELHFFNRHTIIKYVDIVSVNYNKKQSIEARNIAFLTSYIDIKTKTSVITLRIDLYLKEVRELIKARNSSFKEDDLVRERVESNY